MDVSLNSEISLDNRVNDSCVKINNSTVNKNVIHSKDLPAGDFVADCSKNAYENGFNKLPPKNVERNIIDVNNQNSPSSSSNSDEDFSAMCKIAENVDSTLDLNVNSSLLSEQCVVTDDASQQVAKNFTDSKNNCAMAGPSYIFDKKNVNQILNIYKDFRYKSGKENFLKGCKWAPDGTCLLTNCEDKKLRIFDLPTELYTQKEWSNNIVLPELKKTLQVKEGGSIYDYCWYPLMNSWDSASCCFASSSAKEPVHLWDAYTGELRASYRIHNYAEEIVSPLSLNFSPDGAKLFCGFKNNVDVFEVQYPGIKPVTFNIKALGDQSGLVSTIAVNPSVTELFAVGTYQRTVGLYCEKDKCAICIFSGHSGGLTHMLFSPDGSRLYTGSRMDPEIVCWDLRQPGKVLFSLCRTVTTNQRIYFDITPDGKTLVSGNTDGNISVWDLENNKIENGDNGPALPDFSFHAHKDCSNGVSINPCYNLLATSSGQRHFPDLTGDCNDEDAVNCEGSENNNSSEDTIELGDIFDFNSLNNKVENCVKLWWVGPVN